MLFLISFFLDQAASCDIQFPDLSVKLIQDQISSVKMFFVHIDVFHDPQTFSFLSFQICKFLRNMV